MPFLLVWAELRGSNIYILPFCFTGRHPKSQFINLIRSIHVIHSMQILHLIHLFHANLCHTISCRVISSHSFIHALVHLISLKACIRSVQANQNTAPLTEPQV
jgi:hypothetical protein